jgi:nicotinate-nucleotide--dimethylbenzimidazole phosphoribosyltransferase
VVLARPLGARGDLVRADGLTAGDAERLVEAGRSLGRRLAAPGPAAASNVADASRRAAASGPAASGPAAVSGRADRSGLPALVAVGEVGIGNTTVAAALGSGLLGLDPDALVGLGAGSDSRMLATKRRVVRDAVTRFRDTPRPSRGPMTALAALGGGEFAVLAGVVLGIAAGGGVVVLDGMATGVAALVALELEPAVASHLIAGQRSREAGHQHVLEALGLEPILDLRLRAGEGAGACLAVTVVQAGLRIRLDAARVGGPETGPFTT